MFKMGDYTTCIYEIAEILVDDEIVCTVAQRDVEIVIEIIEENLELKGIDAEVKMGDYTNCIYEIAEIVDVDDENEIICTVAQRDVEFVINVLNENETLKN